jgi:hypothetical protein
MYKITTLDNRSTFTIDREIAMIALKRSKLCSSGNNDHILTISNKKGGFHRCSKDKAMLTIINIYISSNIKYKIISIFT